MSAIIILYLMAKCKVEYSCTEGKTCKKLTQTSICKYFTVYKSIPTIQSDVHVEQTTKGKGKTKRKNMTMKKQRIGSVSNFSFENEMGCAFRNTTPRKRKLEHPIFSESEDSDSENDQIFLNISQRNNSVNNSLSQDRTPVSSKEPMSLLKTPKQLSKNAKCLSNSEAESSKAMKMKDLQLPSTSKCVSSEDHLKAVKLNNLESSSASCEIASCSKFSQPFIKNEKLESTITTPKKIKVLGNIVVSPPKKSPEKKHTGNQSVLKKEEKKLNYDTLHVMQEFFLNVLRTNNLNCLLNDTDKNILYKLFNLEDKNYKYTCIKLFTWKHEWYNIFKYVEKIGLKMVESEVITMYNCLKDNNFVITNYLDEELFTLLNLLSLKELREIQRSFKFKNPCSGKDLIIAKLLKNCKTQTTLTYKKSTEQVLRDRVHEKLGFCIKLSDQLAKALKNIYTLNTFTNPKFLRMQDYFRDLNIVFPDYAVEDLQIFEKEEFTKFSQALDLKRDMENALERKKNSTVFFICKAAFTVLKEILHSDEGNSFIMQDIKHLDRFTAQFQYVSILSNGSELLKSSHYQDVKDWLELLISQKYCSEKRGLWFCLLSLIYTIYLKEYKAAAKLIISAFENEKEHLSEVQLHELAFRGKVLYKKAYNLPTLFHDKIAALSPPSCDRDWPTAYIESKAIRSNEGGKKRKYIRDLENGDRHYLKVEDVALEHYKNQGFPDGLHCEGSVIAISFCLLFWDIIYHEYVKGAFISNIQDAPLDMYTKYFYLNRESSIKNMLDNIQSSLTDQELKCLIRNNWNNHSHETSLCSIETIIDNPEDLYKIIECIGRHVLAKILERLVKNYKVYHSGFPDLIVWNHKDKKAKFVEVKGENDTLSIKQKLWLEYLMEIGADVEVCHVHSIGSKKKEVKKKEK